MASRFRPVAMWREKKDISYEEWQPSSIIAEVGEHQLAASAIDGDSFAMSIRHPIAFLVPYCCLFHSDDTAV